MQRHRLDNLVGPRQPLGIRRLRDAERVPERAAQQSVQGAICRRGSYRGVAHPGPVHWRGHHDVAQHGTRVPQLRTARTVLQV